MSLPGRGSRKFDVVVVGGGIAGSAFSVVLAQGGLEVLVLEKTVRFRDENRGEIVWPWGVAEAKRLGVLDTLLGAGGHVVRRLSTWSSLDPGIRQNISLSGIVAGVDGSLNLGHPHARQALLDLAGERGAAIERGVQDIQVRMGEVSWAADAGRVGVRCRLVVGADGRRSVVRQQAGFDYFRGPVEHYATGMLMRSESIPSDTNVACREGSTHFLSFPQGNGFARVYQCFPTTDKARFSGPGRERRFIDAAALESLPDSGAWVAAEAAGPIGTFPCGDSWVASPVRDGFALIGDAGGYNNLLIGQGLSLAMRDARILAQLLLSSDEWAEKQLAAYAAERTRRLAVQRLTARLVASAYRHFRDADDERGRIAQLLAEDELLDGFRNEVFLGGLDRTESEAWLAELRLAEIERSLASTVVATA